MIVRVQVMQHNLGHLLHKIIGTLRKRYIVRSISNNLKLAKGLEKLDTSLPYF